jgi:hypothetical protein
MFQRMVALAKASTARGSRVGLWGRSNVSPHTGLLLWSPNGKSWTRVPGQHRTSDGSITAAPVFKRSMVIAVKDAKGMGPGRPVHAG